MPRLITLDLRGGQDRRQAERRALPRPGSERRHGERRLQTAALAAFCVLGLTENGAMPLPVVEVATHDFRVVPAERAYDALILEAAAAHSVDPALVRAVIRAESRFDARAVSPAGALGLMQLMPHVAAELGVTDPLDPRQNVFGGVRYLSRLLERHHGNEVLALASYNAGPRTVARYGGVPPYRETRGYVRRIRTELARVRQASLDGSAREAD